MDEITLLVAASCVALAFIVYLMWRAATKKEWKALTYSEKKQWRNDEEKRNEKQG